MTYKVTSKSNIMDNKSKIRDYKYQNLSQFISKKLFTLINFKDYVDEVSIYPEIVPHVYGRGPYGRLYFIINPIESHNLNGLSSDKYSEFFMLTRAFNSRVSGEDFIAFQIDEGSNSDSLLLKNYKTFADWCRINIQFMSDFLPEILNENTKISIKDLSEYQEFKLIDQYWKDCNYTSLDYSERYGISFQDDFTTFNKLKNSDLATPCENLNIKSCTSDALLSDCDISTKSTIRCFLLEFKIPFYLDERSNEVKFDLFIFHNEIEKQKKFQNHNLINDINIMQLNRLVAEKLYLSKKESLMSEFNELKNNFIDKIKIVDIGDEVVDLNGLNYKIDKIEIDDNFESKNDITDFMIYYIGRRKLKSGRFSERLSDHIFLTKKYNVNNYSSECEKYSLKKEQLQDEFQSLQNKFKSDYAYAHVGEKFIDKHGDIFIINRVIFKDGIDNKEPTKIFRYGVSPFIEGKDQSHTESIIWDSELSDKIKKQYLKKI